MFRTTCLLIFFLGISLYGEETQGYLTSQEGHKILHLCGTPYQRGYQHGVLLKGMIHHNIQTFIDNQQMQSHPRAIAFQENVPKILPYIPQNILEELRGLSEGSDVPFEKILLLNLFPEMFHCSGIVVQGSATKTGDLYHVRALDYRIGKNLQHTAVLFCVKPEQAYAYLNVSYAGFIGCVTGMNSEQISVGEIGGLGYGHWEGVPMAFLLKEILESSTSLEEVIAVLQKHRRTCEYYYLIADGKQQKAVGVYATASQIHCISQGSNYALLAPRELPANYDCDGMNDKFFLADFTQTVSPYQTAIYDAHKTLVALFHHSLEDSLVITGFAHPWRYPHLIEELQKSWGHITPLSLQNMLHQHTTLSSNLHNAIFAPADMKLWVAHAGKEGEPAYTQAYTCFDLKALLMR